MEVSFLFIFILFIILAILGLGIQVKNFIASIIPGLLAIAAIAAISFGLHCLFLRLRKRGNGRLAVVSEVIMLCSITLGVIIVGILTDMDRCNRWMSWSGIDGMLTYIGIILLANLITLVIACLLPWKRIGSVFLVLAMFVPLALYWDALQVSTRSYSDYVTTDFDSVRSLQEYRVTEDTRIYYPGIFGRGLFPTNLPIKYTGHSFQKDDIVYTVYHPVEYYTERGEAYAVVSDGAKGGLVFVSNLEKVDKTQYSYSLETKTENCRLYKAVPFNEAQTIWRVSEEVLATIPAGERLTLVETGMDEISGEGYLRVYIPEIKLTGYISRGDIAVIRTPVE